VTEIRRAYSSTVVAPGHIAACAVLAAVLLPCGIAFLPTAAAVAAGASAAVIVLAGVQMATVRLMASPGFIRVGQGPWGRPGRVIPAGEVREAQARQFSFLQCFGIGVPFHWKVTRLTVRPGPALELILTDGECIRVSTPNPVTAAQLINSQANAETDKARQRRETTMPDSDRHPAAGKRPWFGPKRIGWGYRPQTWQGWAITLIPVLVVILIIVLTR
jgi:hypothetical protein